MTRKLTWLITWVAETLDRNLIMVPELDEPLSHRTDRGDNDAGPAVPGDFEGIL
jgi:hypothetical protein